MPSNGDLERLRKEIVSRERAVRRKMRRIEGEGVWMQGSEFDPTRAGAPVNRYNRVQARRYLNNLNNFMQRRTQFVPDSYGRPIPRAEWLAYKRPEREANRRADKLRAEVGDIQLPNGLTVNGADAAFRNKDFPKTANAASNSPLHKHERAPENIASRKALRALTKQQQSKVNPKFMDKLVKSGRSDANKMLKEIGDKETARQLRKLSDRQFHILWAYTELPNLISRRYEGPEGKGPNEEGRADAQIREGDIRDTKEWIRWAQGLDESAFGGNNDTRARSNPIVNPKRKRK